MSDPMPAPSTAAEAAGQVHALSQALDEARKFARAYGTAADRAEHLYRREQSKAALTVEGRNADQRNAAVHETRLADLVRDTDGRTDSAAVAEAMGLPADPCATVGELRWLRDRAQRLADQWSATAYDRRHRLQAWMTVAGMARSEAELAPPAPLREVG